MRRLFGVLLIGALLVLPALTHGPLASSARVAAQQKLVFDGDMILWTLAIKPDKTKDFEDLMSKVKDALTKSEKAEYKQAATTWKVFKMGKPLPDGNVVYQLVLTPPAKDFDYTILNILYEANPDPAARTAMYEQYRSAFAATLGQVPYSLVSDMSK